MYSSFHRFFRFTAKSILPLISITFFNLYKQNIHNSQIINNQASQSIQKNTSSTTKLSHRHQGWQWDRIIQINSPQQLTRNDVLQKTIICYQMTGNIQIDSQVALISHQFCDKYFGKITERFQFVFLTPNPHFQVDQQMFFAVFGIQGTRYIPIKKYLTTSSRKFLTNYNPLFNRLHDQVNKYHQISVQNISQHLQHLSTQGRQTYQLVIIPEQNTQQQVNRSKRIMQRFLKNKQIWNSEIVKSVITDKKSQIILGLNKDGIEKNKVYLISPENNNLIADEIKQQQFFKIYNKKYVIISADHILSKLVFPPIPPKLTPQSYILKVNVDLNQARPEMIDQIYQMMKHKELLNLKRVPKLLTFSKADQAVQIYIEKNDHDNIVHVYQQNCMFQQKFKHQLLTGANSWRYPHQMVDSQALLDFVKTVTSKQNDPQTIKKKELYEYYRTQPQAQSVRKHSKLIVGQERKDVLNKEQDKLIFHFSKSCHSCKRFGGVYEDIASQKRDIRFYRIDNDTNKTQGLKNYNSTPVFVMYKKQYKNIPWYFKMPYFTKNLFTSFIQITREVNLLDSKTLKQHIDEHLNNQELVRQTLKQFL